MASSLSLFTAYDEDTQRKLVEGLVQKKMDYFARENQNGELRVDYKKHGSCTPIDPRAYIPDHDLTPRYVCLVFVTVSHMEWNVMVHMGYINNNLGVQLCCLKRIQRMYMNAVARNRPIKNDEEESSADTYLKNKINNFSECTQSNLLTMDYVFVYAPTGGVKRNRDNRPLVQLRNEVQQCKLRMQSQQKLECHQNVHSANVKNRLVTGCHPKPKPSQHDTPVQRPTFIIEGEWGFESNCNVVIMNDECCDEETWAGTTYSV